MTPPLRRGGVERPSASGPTTSDEENGHTQSEALVSVEKENSTKNKDLKVFDFDLSGDEDDLTAEGDGIDKKKAKKNQKGSSRQNKEPVPSKKSTLMRQYMNVQSTATSSSSSKLPKKKRNGNDVSASKKQQASSSKNGQTAKVTTANAVRNTISKLLASKAEELAAKAAFQPGKLPTKASSQPGELNVEASSQAEKLTNKASPLKGREGYACPEVSAVSSTATTTSVNEKRASVNEEEDSGLINRCTKRRNPVPITVVAAKKAPPKRAKLEREESDVETVAMELAPATGLSSEPPSESSQESDSGVKKNVSSGTLVKSEIARRTRSSKKVLSHDITNEKTSERAETVNDSDIDSQLSSISGADVDTTSPSCQEDKELGLRATESPKSPVSSNSEAPRGGRPSPRYTARGRRMSNLSPELKHESIAASAVSGQEERGVSLVMTKKPASGRGTEHDPYTLDSIEDSTIEKTYHRGPTVSTVFSTLSVVLAVY